MKNRIVILLILLGLVLGIAKASAMHIDSLITHSKPHGVVFDDIENDGDEDLLAITGTFVVSDTVNDNAVHLYKRNGNGFTETILSFGQYANNRVYYPRVYDLNNDTYKDIVVNGYDKLCIFFQDASGNFTLSVEPMGKIVEEFSIKNGLVVFSTTDSTVIGLYEYGSAPVFVPTVSYAFSEVSFITENTFMAKNVNGAMKYFLNTSSKTIDSTLLYPGVRHYCVNSAEELVASYNTNAGKVFVDWDNIPDRYFSFPFVPDDIATGYLDGVTESNISFKGGLIGVDSVITDTLSNFNFAFETSHLLAVGDISGDGNDDIAAVVFVPMMFQGVMVLNSGWGASTSTESHEAQETSIEVFPNPATDVVHIKNMPRSATAELFNLEGKMVGATKADQFDMSALPTGPYIMRIDNQRIKLVKSK